MKRRSGIFAFLEHAEGRTHDELTMNPMSRESIRRLITLFLLALLAALAVRCDAKDLAFALPPIAALLLLPMRFYFRSGKQ